MAIPSPRSAAASAAAASFTSSRGESVMTPERPSLVRCRHSCRGISLTKSHSISCSNSCRGGFPLCAEAGFDGAAPMLVALVDPGNQGCLALWLAREAFFQHLDNVAGRQQCEARLMCGALLGDE